MTNYQGNINQKHNDISITMVTIKKPGKNKCWQGC